MSDHHLSLPSSTAAIKIRPPFGGDKATRQHQGLWRAVSSMENFCHVFFFEAQEIFHKTQLRIQDFFGWKILANGYSTTGLWEFIRSSFSSYTPGTLDSHETLESLKWDAGAERLGMLHLAGWQVPFETGKYRTSPQALSNILHPSWIEDIQ